MEEEIKKFVELSAERGKYADIADHKKINSLQKEIGFIANELIKTEEGRAQLFNEMKNPNEYVSVRAAVALIKDKPQEALAVLEHISENSTGWVAAEAYTIIEMNKTGDI